MDMTVKYLAIGTFISMPAMTDFGYKSGQIFEIIAHRIEINQYGVQCNTEIQAVNPETAEYLDKEPVLVNLDMWDYSEI